MKDTDGKIKHFGENDVVADQSGEFVQGSLELSNVNPVEEMVASIDNQRQFERTIDTRPWSDSVLVKVPDTSPSGQDFIQM